MNFKIGQEVVALISGGTHGIVVTKGEIYTVLGVNKCRCEQVIDIGINHPNASDCVNCGHSYKTGTTVWFFSSAFAPIQDNFVEEVLAKAIKEGKELLEPCLNN